MNKELCRNIMEYNLMLIRCVINKEIPEEKPEEITFTQIYHFAKSHSIDNLVFYGIEQLQHKPKGELYLRWKQRRDQAIVKSMVQESEVERLLASYQEAEIDILPLKGIVIRELYPQRDYRTMSDLDILYREEDAIKCKQLMERLGYRVEHFGQGNHDVYHREPVMNVEMHRSLFAISSDYYSYYERIWGKAEQVENQSRCYYLNWNDYYIYLLGHLAKHYYGGGSGIRSFLDVFIFIREKGSLLDEEYLVQELNKLQLVPFRKEVETIANAFFSGEKEVLQNVSEESLLYIGSCGTYGTVNNAIQNKVRKLYQEGRTRNGAKRAYVLQRMFPPLEFMRLSYPILLKYPLCLPGCWIWRLIYTIACKWNRVRGEISTLMRYRIKNG